MAETLDARRAQATGSGASRQDHAWEIPFGWFTISRSSDLAKGQVVPIRSFGTDLVLFRTESGRAQVWNAHCAHNGAHLGYGGRVSGDCITCPFHSWKYGADGKCVSVPYLKDGAPPPAARMRTWPVRENGGFIFTWYGPPDREPTYELPDLGYLPGTDGERSRGSKDWHPFHHFALTVNAPVQALTENMVDIVHVRELHQLQDIRTIELREEGVSLHIEVKGFHGTEHTKFPANLVPPVPIVNTGVCVGFGFVQNVFQFGSLFEALVVFTPRLLERERTEIHAYTSLRRGNTLPTAIRNRALRRAVDFALKRELAQDLVIWNNQRYSHRPVLTRADGHFADYRRWAKQFHPSAAPRSLETLPQTASGS